MREDVNPADATDEDPFRRAFRELRQSNPGLVIDTEEMPVFQEAERAFELSSYRVEMPERPAAWLPGGDLTWLTPKERAAFEQAGGRASFNGASYPGGPGEEPVTCEF